MDNTIRSPDNRRVLDSGKHDMRTALASEVSRQFERLIQQKLPQFRRIHVTDYPVDCPLFEWHTEDMSFYVGLWMNPGDAFGAVGAWSRRGRFPYHLAPVMFPRDVPEEDIVRDEPVSGEFAFPLHWLWGKPEPYEWRLGDRDPIAEFGRTLMETDDAHLDQLQIPDEPPLDQCRAHVRRSVEDVVHKIIQYALPYFDDVATRYGATQSR